MSVEKKDPRSTHMIENICKAYVELLSEKEGAPFFMKDLFEKANIHKSTCSVALFYTDQDSYIPIMTFGGTT